MALFGFGKKERKPSRKGEKSVYVQRLDEIQALVYTLCLKPQGFKRKGRTFCRTTSDGLCQVIDFQIGQVYRGDNDKFFVSIGVRVPESCELSFDLSGEKDFYHEYECNIRTTLYEFTEPGDYKGFNCKYISLRKDEAPKIVEEIISQINEYIIPMFEDLETRDKVLLNREKYLGVTKLFNGQIKLETAMIYGMRGEWDQANRYFNEHYLGIVHEDVREDLRQTAKELGFTIWDTLS